MTHHLFRRYLIASALLRLGLLAYGAYQDAHFAVKYTDVDYKVFSDASRILWSGCPTRPSEQCAAGPLARALELDLGSPYARATYRYTPILALLLLPNELVHPIFGKLLFASCDLLIGALLYSVLEARLFDANTSKVGAKGEDKRASASHWAGLLWLANPMVANISTRGSAESVLGLIVVAMLAAAVSRRKDLAAVLLGVAVHFKIYPVIYAPSLLAFYAPSAEGARRSGLLSWPRRHLTRDRVRLAVVSFGTFMALNLLMYLFWGLPFVQHTYLYHLHRLDHRHNFSPYFYPIYLSLFKNLVGNGSPSPSFPPAQVEPKWSDVFTCALASPLFSFVPQIALCALLGFLFGGKDLPFAFFVQTVAFVALNKVCTSQYFLWFMWFLPLVLPFLRLDKAEAIALLAAWVGGQAIWLGLAYRLEFLGQPVYLPLWAAGIVFLVTQTWIIGRLILAWKAGKVEKTKNEKLFRKAL